VGRDAGRGGLAVAGAKAYFIAIGFLQQIALKRVLGLDGFGALSSALSIASIAYNPVVSTSIQGVSRAVATASDAERGAVTRRVLGLHALLALPLAAVFFWVAEPLGAAAGMPHVVPALKVFAGVLFVYGLYAPLIGVLNGSRRFFAQALFDMLSATLRTVALVGGGWLLATTLGGVLGAAVGFLVAAVTVFLAALFVVGWGRSQSAAGPAGLALTAKAHLLFVAPLFAGQVLLNLLFQADLTLLRTFAAQAAARGGLPLEAADPLVGAYRATQLFSFLPYQLLVSITFVLFPLLASASRAGDTAAVRQYVRTGVRYALLVAGGLVSVTSGLAQSLLTATFGQDVAALGTDALELLSLGFGAFAVFGIFVTVLNSLGKERTATVITALAVGLVAALCTAGMAGAVFSPELVMRTAVSTSVAIVLATLAAGYAVKKAAGAVVAGGTVLRTVLAVAATVAVGRILPTQEAAGVRALIITGLQAGLLGAVYAAALVATREVGRADLDAIRSLGRKRA
jgi:stage V sporulation protein B